MKNICLVDNEGKLIVAIVKGENRASTSKISRQLGIERPRTANPQEILQKTGFICGGVPSFGYSEKSLIKISPQELLKANQGQIIKIRK